MTARSRSKPPQESLRTSPLITAEELHGRLGASDLRVVDVRWVLGQPGAGREAYAAGHIPGALFLDLDTDLRAPEGDGRHPLPDPAVFRETLEAAGIGSTDEVVAYDDARGTIAARLWWMLDALGHERVRLLDGGLGAWTAAGFGVTADVTAPLPRGHLWLRDSWPTVIDREELAGRLGSVVLLDARAGARYRGEVEPIDPVAGHIPTAVSAPVDRYMTADGRLLTPEALIEVFDSIGAAGPWPTVSSCGSGVTATFAILAARVAGLPDPILYPGSYSDWSRSGMPVATGAEPGERPSELDGSR
jgi:thiosulfate/3-mercaptopyruvate sulfurtransferase